MSKRECTTFNLFKEEEQVRLFLRQSVTTSREPNTRRPPSPTAFDLYVSGRVFSTELKIF